MATEKQVGAPQEEAGGQGCSWVSQGALREDGLGIHLAGHLIVCPQNQLQQMSPTQPPDTPRHQAREPVSSKQSYWSNLQGNE